MRYTGKVQNGVVVLEQDAALAEGTVVRVESVASDETPTLDELFRPLAGKAVGLPADMAENHDHDLHGTPKQSRP
jgi:hypothetical protein